MITVRRMAKPAFDRVAYNAAVASGPGGVHPETRALRFEEIIKLALSHPGLDCDVGKVLGKIDDAIHPCQFHDTRVGSGNPRTVAPVLSRAHGIDRHTGIICDADTVLDFGTIGRTNDRRNASV